MDEGSAWVACRGVSLRRTAAPVVDGRACCACGARLGACGAGPAECVGLWTGHSAAHGGVVEHRIWDGLGEGYARAQADAGEDVHVVALRRVQRLAPDRDWVEWAATRDGRRRREGSGGTGESGRRCRRTGVPGRGVPKDGRGEKWACRDGRAGVVSLSQLATARACRWRRWRGRPSTCTPPPV